MARLVSARGRPKERDRRSQDCSKSDPGRKQPNVVPVGNSPLGQTMPFGLRNRSGTWRLGAGRGRSGRAGRIEHKSLAQGMV